MSSGSCHAGLRCLGVDGARSEEHGLGGRLSAANNGLLTGNIEFLRCLSYGRLMRVIKCCMKTLLMV
ncbi:hypothetical protein E2C01_068503 [Portunus trituberculatus]|uniref:Uncharacterized protein n=1 Tax=Portunus trituberculatus TaxID=210409 RepID=A0A5B7I091_PORTR|nr:hypothetical protein [Portunus trituberculatus]